MVTTDYIIDDYIECVESYANYLGYEINDGDTIEECAEHVMCWCNRNNHDLCSLPLPELENIIKLYYHLSEMRCRNREQFRQNDC